MRVTKVKVPQVNRKRHRRTEDPYRIVPKNREITQHQYAPHRAAFPKPEWDDALARSLRGDPLDDESQSKNKAAAQAHDFPRVNQDSEKVGLGQEMQAVHKAKTFR